MSPFLAKPERRPAASARVLSTAWDDTGGDPRVRGEGISRAVQRGRPAGRQAASVQHNAIMSRLARLIGNTNTNPGRGAWLAVGIGIGTAIGVATGSLVVGLGLGAVAGLAVAARGAGG
jgi:hypothetical protein